MSNLEQTLSIIKPDAVERNLQRTKLKNCLNLMVLILKKEKKIQISKMKLKNFIKSIKQTILQ